LVYGPVASRRFGRSLGIDVVPFKACTFDCVYCQLGPTTELTTERRAFVAVEEVLRQVEATLSRGAEVDVITVAGSGEPTLYADLGKLAMELRKLSPAPLLLITNGSLLWREDVALDACNFDIVAPDLDAGDEATFAVINRPHPSLNLEQVADGLKRFSRLFRGKLRLEVFLASGLNDSISAVQNIARRVKDVAVKDVDLNTAARPTPGRLVEGVSRARLDEIAGMFEPKASVIASFSGGMESARREGGSAESVLAMLDRRPCTLAELALGTGCPGNEVAKLLDELVKRDEVTREDRDGTTFFVRGSR